MYYLCIHIIQNVHTRELACMRVSITNRFAPQTRDIIKLTAIYMRHNDTGRFPFSEHVPIVHRLMSMTKKTENRLSMRREMWNDLGKGQE